METLHRHAFGNQHVVDPAAGCLGDGGILVVERVPIGIACEQVRHVRRVGGPAFWYSVSWQASGQYCFRRRFRHGLSFGRLGEATFLDQSRKQSALRDQRAECTTLDDAAFIEHKDQVGVSNRR